MKLLHTRNSPYARRIRVAVREAGLRDQVEEIDVHPIADNQARILAACASGKVPVLVTDAGMGLCETLVIARHLDKVSGGKLYPRRGNAREAALEIEALASALMDTLFVRSRENRREAALRSDAAIATERERARRLYDALEARAGALGKRMRMDTISVGCALGYADGRHPGDGWRDGRPALAAWYARMLQRPSMSETTPAF